MESFLYSFTLPDTQAHPEIDDLSLYLFQDIENITTHVFAKCFNKEVGSIPSAGGQSEPAEDPGQLT